MQIEEVITCKSCPKSEPYAQSLDKAMAGFKNAAWNVIIRTSRWHLASSVGSRIFSRDEIARAMAHAAHTGGGRLIVTGDHTGAHEVECAEWTIAGPGRIEPTVPGSDCKGFLALWAWQI